MYKGDPLENDSKGNLPSPHEFGYLTPGTPDDERWRAEYLACVIDRLFAFDADSIQTTHVQAGPDLELIEVCYLSYEDEGAVASLWEGNTSTSMMVTHEPETGKRTAVMALSQEGMNGEFIVTVKLDPESDVSMEALLSDGNGPIYDVLKGKGFARTEEETTVELEASGIDQELMAHLRQLDFLSLAYDRLWNKQDEIQRYEKTHPNYEFDLEEDGGECVEVRDLGEITIGKRTLPLLSGGSMPEMTGPMAKFLNEELDIEGIEAEGEQLEKEAEEFEAQVKARQTERSKLEQAIAIREAAMRATIGTLVDTSDEKEGGRPGSQTNRTKAHQLLMNAARTYVGPDAITTTEFMDELYTALPDDPKRRATLTQQIADTVKAKGFDLRHFAMLRRIDDALESRELTPNPEVKPEQREMRLTEIGRNAKVWGEASNALAKHKTTLARERAQREAEGEKIDEMIGWHMAQEKACIRALREAQEAESVLLEALSDPDQAEALPNNQLTAHGRTLMNLRAEQRYLRGQIEEHGGELPENLDSEGDCIYPDELEI